MNLLRLRTQLFIGTLLIIVGLAGTLLLAIHHAIGATVAGQVSDSTRASVRALEDVQKQRAQDLARTTEILSELPTMKALMTTQDPLTIQDGSEPFWKLAGSDLFVLAGNNRVVMAVHAKGEAWNTAAAHTNLQQSMERGVSSDWWLNNGRLYWVFIGPIVSGIGTTSRELGLLAVGYEIDAKFAKQLSQASGNQLAISSGGALMASTLPPEDQRAFASHLSSSQFPLESTDFPLVTDHYVFASTDVPSTRAGAVRCYVLMPLAPVSAFVHHLDRTILALGILAILIGGLLFGFVARRMTLPLDHLVFAVRALAAGDFRYSLSAAGSSEVAELNTSFEQMRSELLKSQQQRIETERLAAVAQAASSISHDLRHYLAAVVANAEFLYEANDVKFQREEIYEEIKTASDQMIDLIDSFRELSNQHNAIAREPADLEIIIRRAMEAIRARPEFRKLQVTLHTSGNLEGLVDPRKLERVFFNLLLNACEASVGVCEQIEIYADAGESSVAIRVKDAGRGIPYEVRATLFNPFVSSGKVSGTGLGLAIVNKIVGDHGGEVRVESSSGTGTVMLVTLPRVASMVTSAVDVSAHQ